MVIIRLYTVMQPADWTPALPTLNWKKKKQTEILIGTWGNISRYICREKT